MYQDMLPDTVYLNPMEYKSHRCAPPPPLRQAQTTMNCVLVGAVALAVILFVQQQNRMMHYGTSMLVNPIQGIAGMVSHVARGVSARIASTSARLTDGSKIFPAMPAGTVEVLDNTSNPTNPTAPTPDAVKRANHEALVKFIKDPANHRACIVVHAHWCPHCHKVVQEIVDKADSLKGNGVRYLLVNGDAVHSDAFQGPDAIIPLRHYPTILSKVGNMGKEVASLDEATEAALSAEEETTEEEQVQTEEEETQEREQEEQEDPLAMLF